MFVVLLVYVFWGFLERKSSLWSTFSWFASFNLLCLYCFLFYLASGILSSSLNIWSYQLVYASLTALWHKDIHHSLLIYCLTTHPVLYWFIFSMSLPLYLSFSSSSLPLHWIAFQHHLCARYSVCVFLWFDLNFQYFFRWWGCIWCCHCWFKSDREVLIVHFNGFEDSLEVFIWTTAQETW